MVHPCAVQLLNTAEVLISKHVRQHVYSSSCTHVRHESMIYNRLAWQLHKSRRDVHVRGHHSMKKADAAVHAQQSSHTVHEGKSHAQQHC